MKITQKQIRIMEAYLATATLEKGTKERPGAPDNPRIAEYLHSTTIGAPYDDNDETPWCSAFVCWVVDGVRKRLGNMAPQSTRSARARDWLSWGIQCPAPLRGAIVVFRRGTGPRGHVAFCLGASKDGIRVIGGNQAEAVTENTYPESHVLGYRLPIPG